MKHATHGSAFRLTHWPAIACVLAALTLRAADPPAPTFTNVTVHDPSVVRDGSTYYVFGSHLASASTTDLMNWTQITTDDVNPNPLIRNGTPLAEFAAALTYAGGATTFWGPDVIKLGDGNYYFYYCACQGSSPLSALGLAKAAAVTGPYANVGILLKSSGGSPTVTPYDVNVDPNVVDPSVFFDHTGKLWMVYGSFSGGIFILQLDSTVGSATIGQPIFGQGYGKKLIGGNSSRIEGPYIIYSPETSYYYLFMTFGGLDAAGGYNVRVGRSPNPDGPYLDAAGNNLTTVKGNYPFDDATIAPYGVKLMGNWQFLHVTGEPGSTSRGYVSPGGVSINRDATTGRYLLVFHARFVGSGEIHQVRVHQLYLNADGWFVAAPQRYAGEMIAATDAGRIVGNWKLINHGKDITATVKTSSLITLQPDGSVTGAITGTWQLSGDYHATLTLAGTSYRGVFARQWNDDSQVWVLAFSAVSGDGVAVWGSKVAIDTSPAFITQPASQVVVAGAIVTLTAVVSGDPAPTYQWQCKPVGSGTWSDLAEGGAYSNTTTGTLKVSGATTAMSGDQFQCVATNRVNSATSDAVTLTVYSADEAFLRRLFVDVLGRAIDPGALSSFGAALAGGWSQAAVLGDLLGSAEYNQRQVEPAIRLYFAALARPPDYAGLQNWSNALRAGVLTLTGAADQFAASPEFTLKYGSLDNTGYVQQLYRNVLGREADAAGLADWVSQLNAGASRGTVLSGFSESPEFQADIANQVEILRLFFLLLQRMPTATELQDWQGFLLGDGQTDTVFAQRYPAGLADPDYVQLVFQGFLRRAADAGALSAFGSALTAGTVTHGGLVNTLLTSTEFNTFVAPVSRLYLAAFRRVPDAPGLDNWVAYVRGGNSLQSAADAFVASPEFQLTYGSLDDTQYVTLLYENVLGRPADSAGLADWVGRLNAGATRGQILIGFSESQEGIRIFAPTVRTFLHFFTFLNSTPTQSDLGYWKNYLATLDDQLRQTVLTESGSAGGG